MKHTPALDVAMFSAEATPFAKVGGLADVVGALPQNLERLGARVSVFLPAYGAIDFDAHGIQPFQEMPAFSVTLGKDEIPARVYRTVVPGTGIQVFLFGGRDYFSRDGIYDDPKTRMGFEDNAERFIFFMKAGLLFLRGRGIPVHVIHCHDSHTALVPGLLRTVYRDDPFFARTGVLLTIHNLAHQGLFPPQALALAGIASEHFHPGSPFEYWGKLNFMKAGIELADLVNTVSETYAREIQAGPEYGYGLEGVLKTRSAHLSGIVNGIDYTEWNPETDRWIPASYSADDLAGKAICKRELRRDFALPEPAREVPLVGIVSRLADQKGFDLIEKAMRELAALDLQLVVLGTGQQKYQDLFQALSDRHPEKVAARFVFDNALAHRVEAGADMFLMPSKYEPCGLNQLYSLRYGTVPIVRATGGLADTIIDYDGRTGTGFSFHEYSSGEMMTAIRRALRLYGDPPAWRKLVIRCMSQDWSWRESAKKYLRLYQKIYNQRHG